MDYVVAGSRCLLVIVFMSAVAGKVFPARSFGEFRDSIRSLRILPPALVAPAAYGTVAAEACAVPLLAVPGAAPVGAAVAATLLLVFVGVITTSMRRGVRARCRCFGAAGAQLGARHVGRNTLLLLVAGVAAVPVPGSGMSDATRLAPAIVLAAVAATVVIRLDDVIDLMGRRRPSHPNA